MQRAGNTRAGRFEQAYASPPTGCTFFRRLPHLPEYDTSPERGTTDLGRWLPSHCGGIKAALANLDLI